MKKMAKVIILIIVGIMIQSASANAFETDSKGYRKQHRAHHHHLMQEKHRIKDHKADENAGLRSYHPHH